MSEQIFVRVEKKKRKKKKQENCHFQKRIVIVSSVCVVPKPKESQESPSLFEWLIDWKHRPALSNSSTLMASSIRDSPVPSNQSHVILYSKFSSLVHQDKTSGMKSKETV